MNAFDRAPDQEQDSVAERSPTHLVLIPSYNPGRKVFETVPNDVDVLNRCTPIYQEFDGWQTSTKLVRDFEDLPKRARIASNSRGA